MSHIRIQAGESNINRATSEQMTEIRTTCEGLHRLDGSPLRPEHTGGHDLRSSHLEEGAPPLTGHLVRVGGDVAVSSTRISCRLRWVWMKMLLPNATAWKREIGCSCSPCNQSAGQAGSKAQVAPIAAGVDKEPC